MFFPLRDDNPTRSAPLLSYLLMALNIGAFLWVQLLEAKGVFWVNHWYGLVPVRLLQDPGGELVTLFTSMFLHGGWYHLGSNLWFLYVFGDNVEDRLGKFRFIAFYLGCGVAAALAQITIAPGSSVPMVGASGAIAGVIGAYLVLYPRAPILALNTIPLLWLFTGVLVVVPAWLIAGLFFLSNLGSAYMVLGNVDGAGVAFFAHLGGFVAGFGSIKLWAPSHSAPSRVGRGFEQRRSFGRRSR